jgi:hypothetical protein
MIVGETLTDKTWPGGSNAQAVTDSKNKVFNYLQIRNQHIRNFGATDPMNSQGADVFNVSSSALSQRITLMRGGGSTQVTSWVPLVLTAAVAPAYLNGGDTTPPGSNSLAPVYPGTANQAFADLMGRIVAYYNGLYGAGCIYAIQVWNEFKGMWNGTNAWDNARYMDLFSRCFTAIKAQDSTVLIGGPYAIISGPYAGGVPGGHPQTINGSAAAPLTIGSYGNVDLIGVDSVDYFVRYCMAHSIAYDFICWDGRTKDGSTGQNTGDHADRASAYYGTVTSRLRSVATAAGDSGTTPLWCSEFHVGQESPGPLSDSDMAAAYTAGLTAASDAGLAVALIWGDQATGTVNIDKPGTWTNVANVGGGQPTLAGQAILDFIATPPIPPLQGGSGSPTGHSMIGQGREVAAPHNNLGIALGSFQGPEACLEDLREGIGFAGARGLTEMRDGMPPLPRLRHGGLRGLMCWVEGRQSHSLAARRATLSRRWPRASTRLRRKRARGTSVASLA